MAGEEILSPVQSIRRVCADAFGLEESALLSKLRARHYSVPRQATCYVLRQRFGLSYPEIARLMGRGDHSTIIHAVRQTEARIARDAVLEGKVRSLIGFPMRPRAHDAHVIAWRHWRTRWQRAVVAPDSELAEFVDLARTFCGQCDRAVTGGEARRCSQRLCGLKASSSAAVGPAGSASSSAAVGRQGRRAA